MDRRRVSLIHKAARLPEFEQVPDSCKDEVVDACLRRFSQRRCIRLLEAGFVVCLCAAGLLGLIVGYFQWRFWGALLLMTLLVFATSALFAVIFRYAWRRWLRDFTSTGELTKMAEQD